MGGEIFEILNDIVEAVCLEFLVKNPEGNRKKNQAHERTQAMKQFFLHRENTGISSI
jgi:hypothetical protein